MLLTVEKFSSISEIYSIPETSKGNDTKLDRYLTISLVERMYPN